MSARTTSVCPSAAAHIKAVCPREASFAFTSAPWARSMLIASSAPVREHVISTVSPLSWAAFAFAPAFNSLSTIGALALVHASEAAVISPHSLPPDNDLKVVSVDRSFSVGR